MYLLAIIQVVCIYTMLWDGSSSIIVATVDTAMLPAIGRTLSLGLSAYTAKIDIVILIES